MLHIIVLAAALYRVIGVPAPDRAVSTARAVNQRGVVAGAIAAGAFSWDGTHLVRYKRDQFLYLDGDYTNIAVSINDAGIAVGRNGSYMPVVMSGLEVATATLYRNGTMEYLDKSFNGTFEADGINDAGVIVGMDGFRGFVRLPDGTLITVAPLSSRDENNGTRATAIDNEGDIVGATTIPVSWTLDVSDPDGPHGYEALPIHAFLMHLAGGRQHTSDLGTIPGFIDTFATAVSDDGTVVGYSGTQGLAKTVRVSGPSHAWVWYHGRMTDLGTLPSSESSAAFGVNDHGVVVGCSGDPTKPWWYTFRNEDENESRDLAAVRWVNKKIQDLNDLIPPASGWHLLCARAINRNGEIVGDGLYNGLPRGFVLVPKR
jgi:probable HAF family extracellular repeat protein